MICTIGVLESRIEGPEHIVIMLYHTILYHTVLYYTSPQLGVLFFASSRGSGNVGEPATRV